MKEQRTFHQNIFHRQFSSDISIKKTNKHTTERCNLHQMIQHVSVKLLHLPSVKSHFCSSCLCVSELVNACCISHIFI